MKKINIITSVLVAIIITGCSIDGVKKSELGTVLEGTIGAVLGLEIGDDSGTEPSAADSSATDSSATDSSFSTDSSANDTSYSTDSSNTKTYEDAGKITCKKNRWMYQPMQSNGWRMEGRWLLFKLGR